ncbi:MAG: Flp pilus assembly complex ATPase component TadA [Erysipelothrix sp.]|nr:Flp pilus assembly complex ATPase component TadA [Erysipelothrix sp.]
MISIPLGQLLLEENIISQDQLNEALARQKVLKKRLGEVIIDLGYVSEKDILLSLAKRLKIEYVENPILMIDFDVIRLVPESFARKHEIFPLYLRLGTLTIATNDPLDFNCLEDLSMITGLEVKTVISSKSDINKAIERAYRRSNTDELMDDIRADGLTDAEFGALDMDDANMAERVESAPVVKLVNSIIMEAYQQNASDIHIEPEETFTRVRFRIDGDLQLYSQFTHEVHQLITTRIKIISGMNIAEKRIPQDGGLRYRNDYARFDLRISTIPTAYGEKVVMRLLGADKNISYDLHSLGLSNYTIGLVEKALRLPHGILLVTGPTGSGKTTTLYSMLAKLNDPTKAIVTIEDPIERKFESITQVQVNTRAGLTFASGLRSILRQDPDTIMVGEIRDTETAEIAIRAAITGHFVLSTIHTNDALSTVVRLTDMGIEPFLVASSVKCVISQRLVKKICTHCKMEVEVESSDNLLLGTHLTHSHIGKGCKFCNNTGYSGRTAVFETILIDSALEQLISHNASMDELKKYAKEKKMRMLADEVIDLIKEGITSVEEGVNILYSTD